jgi:hypothetical protein
VEGLAKIETCAQASLALSQRNLRPHGILAASPTEAAIARRHTRIFGRDAGLYLSFVKLACVGNEGDDFGNLLAILCGLADESTGHRIVKTIWFHRQSLQPMGMAGQSRNAAAFLLARRALLGGHRF